MPAISKRNHSRHYQVHRNTYPTGQSKKIRRIFILSSYHPSDTNDTVASALNVESYLTSLSTLYHSLPNTTTILAGGDINAKIGTKRSELDLHGARAVLGKFGSTEANEKGQTLFNFFLSSNLALANTFFHHSTYNTYLDPKGCAHQYDYWAISQQALKSVKDARVISYGAPSDHKAVLMTLRVSVSLKRPKAKRNKSIINWRALRDPHIRKNFQSAVMKTNKIGDTYTDFNANIMKAAKSTLVSDRKRPDWFTRDKETLFSLIQERNSAITVKKSNPSIENSLHISIARSKLKMRIQKAKRDWEDETASEFEEI